MGTSSWRSRRSPWAATVPARHNIDRMSVRCMRPSQQWDDARLDVLHAHEPAQAVAGVEAVRAGPLHVQVAWGDDRRADGLEGATVEGVGLGQAHRLAVDEHLASPPRHDITRSEERR